MRQLCHNSMSDHLRPWFLIYKNGHNTHLHLMGGGRGEAEQGAGKWTALVGSPED